MSLFNRMKRAAEAGSAEGMYALGTMYFYDNGTPQDYTLALAWMEKAAKAGHIGARYSLGKWLAEGTAGEKDIARAEMWLRTAADRDHPEAAVSLFRLFAEQLDEPINIMEAARWRDRAEALGSHHFKGLKYGDDLATARATQTALLLHSDDIEEALYLYIHTLLDNPTLPRLPEDQLEERIATALENESESISYAVALMRVHDRWQQEQDIYRGESELRALAETGNTCAQARLFRMYQNRQGPLFDVDKAACWQLQFQDNSQDFLYYLMQWHGYDPGLRPPPPSATKIAQERESHADRAKEADPVTIYRCPPYYPFTYRAHNIEGEIIAEFTIDTQGNPQDIKILDSPRIGFEKAAIDAVRLWRFAPALKDGKPIAVTYKVPLEFKITN